MRHALVLLVAWWLNGCCDPARPRLVSVHPTSDAGQLGAAIRWDGSDNELSRDGYFTVYRRGSPAPGLLRTIPMLQLHAEDGGTMRLLRFAAANDGDCAAAELYEPEEVAAGQRFRLVHPSSAAPGDLDDSGEPLGELADHIVAYEGEYALVAEIVVVDGANR